MRTFTGEIAGLLSDQSAAEVAQRLSAQGSGVDVDTVPASSSRSSDGTVEDSSEHLRGDLARRLAVPRQLLDMPVQRRADLAYR